MKIVKFINLHYSKAEQSKMQRVINFSGGKSSAYMTILNYQPGDIVLFCDTGREHPKTYKFLNDFEAFEGIPVTRIRYTVNSNNKPIATTETLPVGAPNPFKQMLIRKKHRALPRRTNRYCTVSLKIHTARRYLRSIGLHRYIQMIGFRGDEPTRVKRHVERLKSVTTVFPLYEKMITKPMVNQYWSTKPYNLEIPSILGNCTLCFVKGHNAIMAILREYPELANEWIQDEAEVEMVTGRKDISFVEGWKIKDLLQIAQNNLFKDYPLEDIEPAFNCACTS